MMQYASNDHTVCAHVLTCTHSHTRARTHTRTQTLTHTRKHTLSPHPQKTQVVSERISYQPHYRTLTDAGKCVHGSGSGICMLCVSQPAAPDDTHTQTHTHTHTHTVIRSHFSDIAYAVADLVDNSIQAAQEAADQAYAENVGMYVCVYVAHTHA